MSRQIDVHMPHDGEHQYDELDDDPKCAFQPARHPNACERPSSQHERYLTRALRPNYCVPSTASRFMILFTPRGHYLAGTPRLTAPFRVPSRYLAGAEPNVPAGFVLVPKAVYEAPLQKTLLILSGPPTRRTSTFRPRKAPGLPLPEALLHAELATEAGLPETDEAAGHQRTEDGQVVPKAESVAQNMLQRPAPSDVCALRTRLAVC